MSDTPTADPNILSTGWGLSKAEYAQAISALQRAGVPAERLNPVKVETAARKDGVDVTTPLRSPTIQR
jgi:hypothetical protein